MGSGSNVLEHEMIAWDGCSFGVEPAVTTTMENDGLDGGGSWSWFSHGGGRKEEDKIHRWRLFVGQSPLATL